VFHWPRTVPVVRRGFRSIPLPVRLLWSKAGAHVYSDPVAGPAGSA
jgi:hypothetical protein